MLGNGVARRSRLGGPITLFLQPVDQRPSDQGLVVDDEDGSVGHQQDPATSRLRSVSSNGLLITIAPRPSAAAKISGVPNAVIRMSVASGNSCRSVASSDRSLMSGRRRSRTTVLNGSVVVVTFL